MAATLALAGSADLFPAQDHPVTVAQHYANFVAAITATVPAQINYGLADPLDIEERADHLAKVMEAVNVYVTAVARETASNSTAKIDWQYLAGFIDDARGEVVGELFDAAHQLWNEPRRVA